MAIISLNFALFVIITLAIYYLLPGKVQNLFLLLASYYFYSTWSWGFALILIVLTLFNYFYAQHLHRCQTNQRLLLWLGVGADSAILLFFLLGGIFGKGFHSLFSRFGFASFEATILLPLGLGYRVLESISYLVDIYLKISKPSTNLVDYALYTAYFPKLVSGPIERARKFLPQITEKRLIDNATLAKSSLLILVGLVRTTLLAGMLTVLSPVSPLSQPKKHSGPELLMGMLVFAFYLYNQFAGYTDIVRGVSGLFGVELTRNFAFPFFSKNFSDFWKRWHISLSQWLRDYIYMPLSRALLRRNPSRANKANLILPPMATMLVSGVWHGASLNLLVWGALNGAYIVVENFLNLSRPVVPSAKNPFWRQVLSSLAVICFALLAAIPFRLSLKACRAFLVRLVFAWEWQLPDLRLFVVMALSLLVDWMQARRNDEFIFLKWPRWGQALAAALVVIAVIIVYHLQTASATFVYP